MTSHVLARPLAVRVVNLIEPQDVLENPPVSQAVMQAAFKAMHDGQTHYTDRPGIGALREKAVNSLGRRYGIELTPAEVTITCGGAEARFVALKMMVKAGTRIITAGTIEPLQAAAKLLDIEIAAQPDDADTISVVYITSHDAPEKSQPLLDLAEKHGWWIIFEAHNGAQGQFHPAQNPALAPHTLTIGSADDSMPGWRVGWMAGSEMANKLRAFKQSMTICTTSVSQWAALGLSEDESE